MYDLFDPKTLTQQQLLDKRMEVTKMMMHYRATGFSSLTGSLELLLAVVDEELEYRNGVAVLEHEKKAKEDEEKANKKKNRYAIPKKQQKKDTIVLGHIKGVDD